MFWAASGLAEIALIGQYLSLPSMPASGGTTLRGLWETIRIPRIASGMLGVVLMFGGRQTFVTYIRPFLEHVTHLSVNGISLSLLVLGVASFAGTSAASSLLGSNVTKRLGWLALTQAAAVSMMLFLGTSAWMVGALLVVWGFAAGATPVSWSTWLTHAIPERAESGGGILVAAIQGSMLLGASAGGLIIDAFGRLGPLVAAAIILALGASHSFLRVKREEALG